METGDLHWHFLSAVFSHISGGSLPITGTNLKIFGAVYVITRQNSIRLAAWNHWWGRGVNCRNFDRWNNHSSCFNLLLLKRSDVEHDFHGSKLKLHRHFRFYVQETASASYLHRWARHGLPVVKLNRLWEWNSTKRLGIGLVDLDLDHRSMDRRCSAIFIHFQENSMLEKPFGWGIPVHVMCNSNCQDRQRLMEETLNRWHQQLEGLTLCCSVCIVFCCLLEIDSGRDLHIILNVTMEQERCA